MPAKHIQYIRVISDPSESNGLPIEIVYAPPGVGVIATRPGITQKYITDAIIRASVAECTGMPFFAYDADTLGPPGGSVEYLMRWHGAGVLDQSFSHNVPFTLESEGVLVGNGINPLFSVSGACEVLNENLRVSAPSGWARVSEIDNHVRSRGLCFGWKLENIAPANYGVVGPGDSARKALSITPYIGSRNYDLEIQGGHTTSTNFFINSSDILPNGFYANMFAVIGGFNASGEPLDDVGATHGAFLFQQDSGGNIILLYLHAIPAVAANFSMHMTASTAANALHDISHLFVPDADLSDLTVPVAADLFTGSNGTALIGKAADIGGNWLQHGASASHVIASNKAHMLSGGTDAIDRPGILLEGGSVDLVMRAIISDRLSSAIPAFFIRKLDDNNFNRIYMTGGTALAIGEIVAGVVNELASTTATFANDNPLVVSTDGDTIIAVYNNSKVVSALAVTEIAGTKCGISNINATGDCKFDNFSAYPRRSVARYDNKLLPYLP